MISAIRLLRLDVDVSPAAVRQNARRMARRYRRTSSEVAGTFGFFSVERHRVVPEGGPGAAEHTTYTLTFAPWVAVAAVTADERFVLVRQFRHGVEAETLETPGGIVDEGEAPAAAALRELREETGFAGEAAESLGAVHANAALQSNLCHLFLVRGVRVVGSAASDEHESTEAVTLTRAELRAALAEGRITHAFSVVALERALARLES
jgi:ADP-ribose pyrophosphatase